MERLLSRFLELRLCCGCDDQRETGGGWRLAGGEHLGIHYSGSIPASPGVGSDDSSTEDSSAY